MASLRKIETKEELESKEKKRTMILSGLMLLILFGSVAGYAFLYSGTGGKTVNNSSGIQNLNGEWIANFSGQELIFSNPPESVKNVSINLTFDIRSYYQEPIYISSNDTMITYEISSNLGKFSSRMQNACYGPCNTNLPEKNCTDFLIIYNPNNTSRIYQNDNCVFIDGNLTTADAFLYRIFGLA